MNSFSLFYKINNNPLFVLTVKNPELEMILEETDKTCEYFRKSVLYFWIIGLGCMTFACFLTPVYYLYEKLPPSEWTYLFFLK